MKKVISPPRSKRPVIIQSDITRDKKITIIVEGGVVEDIVKEKCSEIDVEVHDYDVDQQEDENLFIDKYGRKFNRIVF
jgi:hypothetical protein